MLKKLVCFGIQFFEVTLLESFDFIGQVNFFQLVNVNSLSTCANVAMISVFVIGIFTAVSSIIKATSIVGHFITNTLTQK